MRQLRHFQRQSYTHRTTLSKSLQGLQRFGRTGYTSNLCRKASTIMTKRITRDDPMYIEALSWMSYRYAIGITEYPHRNGLSEAERYRMFRDIEFNTPEFQALSAAFTDFLKRKKITDVVALRDQYRENDLIGIQPYRCLSFFRWSDIICHRKERT